MYIYEYMYMQSGSYVTWLIYMWHASFMWVMMRSFVEWVREVGGWGRDPFSRNFMKPTPRRKWYLTTGRSFHEMVLDPIPQSLPVHFFGSRPQPPTSRVVCVPALLVSIRNSHDHTDMQTYIHKYTYTHIHTRTDKQTHIRSRTSTP